MPMGDYCVVQPYFALSELTGAEQTFLNEIWDRTLCPAEDDQYFAKQAERSKLHQERGLPGTSNAWDLVVGKERKDDRYVTTLRPIPPQFALSTMPSHEP